MMTNDECISRLEGLLSRQENIEDYILNDDGRDLEELREVERDIEALRRGIQALERTNKKRKKVDG